RAWIAAPPSAAPATIDSATLNRVFMISLHWGSAVNDTNARKIWFLGVVAALLGDTKRPKFDRLIRTDRAALHPGVKERACLRLRAGRGPTIPSRSPGPADQMILTYVMHDVFERAAAIARGIFDLLADLRERLALPAHLMRREMPARIARHAGRFEIGRLVADRAAHRRQSEAVVAARDRRLMQTPDVALARTIAGGMAIYAARMGQHFANLG